MSRFIATAEGLATATGVAILMATTNANIMATGGYFTSHAVVVAALSAGVFAGARVVGAKASGTIALVIIAALSAGELYNLSATAERIVVERENGAAPLKAAMAKHNGMVEKLHHLEGAPVLSARLTLAKQTKTAADAAYETELREGGRCKTICNGLKAKADEAQKEVVAALTEAQGLVTKAIDDAKDEVAANPLPASATPLADRLGWPAWVLDLIMAGLLSVGANGLAGVLVAFGASNQKTEFGFPKTEFGQPKTEFGQTDFSVSDFDATALRAMVAGDLPEPTPPKPGKRKKVAQLPANVVSFAQHPVVTALKNNGGSVSSNRELASLMAVTEGEASKRRQEVENRLEITRVGKEMRIALKA